MILSLLANVTKNGIFSFLAKSENGQGRGAVDRSHEKLDALLEDQFLGHCKADIGLELFIPGHEFDLLPEDPAFGIHFVKRHFEPVADIIGKGGGGAGIGVNNPDLDGIRAMREGNPQESDQNTQADPYRFFS